MTETNKTLYIPLYGKAFVSWKGIILDDKKAEYIWNKEALPWVEKAKASGWHTIWPCAGEYLMMLLLLL